MDIQDLIEDFQARLREYGIETNQRMELNNNGEVTAFRFVITERYE